MQKFRNFITPAVITLALLLTACGSSSDTDDTNDGPVALTEEQELGKKIFFDENLSSHGNQSCADCHNPVAGFADPDVSKIAPVSEGSLTGEFGNRNAPTSAYASFIPDFTLKHTQTLDLTDSKYQGGQFLDGRAADLVAQAKGPFLNPVEMNNGEGILGKTNVVNKVQAANYADDFLSVYGAEAFNDVETAYNNIATAIASFEESSEMNPFTSKFDAFRAGQVLLSDSEARGLELFMHDAKCANCHTISRPPAASSDANSLFTDFNYFNIGVPVNPNNPTSGIDVGLAANPDIEATDIETEKGKFRTPTLRNIELTAPYMHNGVYETLEEVIRHYDISVADYVDPDIEPLFFFPEVEENIANELKIRLNLQPQDYIDLENFMLTLTDGYTS